MNVFYEKTVIYILQVILTDTVDSQLAKNMAVIIFFIIIVIIILTFIIINIMITVIIITRPWPAFGRQGLDGSSERYNSKW